MTSILDRCALSRRGFLRGAGACVALPWLDAMQPAVTRSERPSPRALFVFAPNGKKIDEWRPRGEGASAELPYLLEPLREVWSELSVFSGLAIDGGRGHGDGPGDHARSAASFLTCAHPKKTGGADLRAGVSVDQVLAQAIGGASVLPSLELGMEPGAAAGVCDSGYSCAYSNNVSWRSPGTPAAKGGLKDKDVIIEFDGKPVRSQSDMFFKVAEVTPGTQVSIKVLRETKEKELKVELAERDARALQPSRRKR